MNNDNIDNEYNCDYDSENTNQVEMASIYATNNNTQSDFQGTCIQNLSKIFNL